jgi:uncharacterized membrane protein YccC
VERGRIVTWGALRMIIVALILILVPWRAGHVALALPLVAGALFVAVADSGEAIGRRWRTMLWTTLWLMVAALLGGISSDSPALALALTIPITLICGVAGAAGPRAGVAGVLSLVMFVVISGAPESVRTGEQTVLLVGLGGLVITAATVIPHLVTSRDSRAIALEPVAPVWHRLRGRLTRNDPFVRHAARLTITIFVAMSVSEVLTLPHDYWMPMTVAWVTKPDADGTVSKVLARLAGTVVGLLVIAAIFEVVGVRGAWMAFTCAVATGVVVAFIWANYAIAVAAITILFVGMFTFEGDPVGETLAVRFGCTVLAGGLVLAGSFLWRARGSDVT